MWVSGLAVLLALAPARQTAPQTHLRSRRQFMHKAAALATVAKISYLQAVNPANAESTLITRQQAYTRYVPRIERGRDYWENSLSRMIQSADWNGIQKELDKKGSIDRLFGPMELWASSFSGKTISPKTLGMNDAIGDLRLAVADLKFAATGTEGSGGLLGFFSGPKKLDENKRKQLAQAAYASGKTAINKYIELGNDSLGMQLTPLDLID